MFVSTTSHDELGHPVTLHLDAFGRAVRKEEPLGAATVKTDYTYDALGRLTGIADDVGNTWAYTHDSLGRTLTVDDPDLGIWTKTYDDAGQLLTQTDALSQVTRFTPAFAGAGSMTRSAACSPRRRATARPKRSSPPTSTTRRSPASTMWAS